MCKIDKFFQWLQTTPDVSAFQTQIDTVAGWGPSELLAALNFANTYCLEANEEYLEIGTYCGRSLAGALQGNACVANVIDPFDKHMPDGDYIFSLFQDTIKRYEIGDRVKVHKMFCHEFDASLNSIGVFMYDGDHDSGHTYEGLKRFEKYLSKEAIIIVDDYYIFGGDGQKAYPGHAIVREQPVKVDTDRWIEENKDKIVFTKITPWSNRQMIIGYRR